jgi:hypothetical protein
MSEQARVFYEGLKGITERHDAHRRSAASMRSTGYVAFRAIIEEEVDFTALFEWLIEYKCDVCHELVYESDPEHYDLVLAALKESGYLPA